VNLYAFSLVPGIPLDASSNIIIGAHLKGALHARFRMRSESRMNSRRERNDIQSLHGILLRKYICFALGI